MHKIVFGVLLLGLFAMPCFAADTTPSSDAILEQIVKSEIAKTSALLLAAGREKESAVLLAAAAELLTEHDLTLKDEDGKEINAVAIYAEAIEAAKKADNGELAEVLEKQSRIVGDRHGRHRHAAYGWYWNRYGQFVYGYHRHR